MASSTSAAPVHDAGPSALVDFVAGTVGGIASLLAGHPFDTIKTRLQAQPATSAGTVAAPARAVAANPSVATPLLASAAAVPLPSPSALAASTSAALPPPRYVSATHALRVIVREEKVLGLYKGVTSPMLGVALMNASIFGVYGLALRVQASAGLFTWSSARPPDHHGGASLMAGSGPAQPTLTQIFVAGMASGLVSALITSPIELVKIREQLDASSSSSPSHRRRDAPGTWGVVRGLWRRGGLRSLYRGLGCTCIRDLGYGPYFWSYELLNRLLVSLHGGERGGVGASTAASLSAAELALSGGLAGVIAWLSTFWADVVKTKVQATDAPSSAMAPSPTTHRGPGRRPSGTLWARCVRASPFLQAASQTYAQGGVGAFFVGVKPTVLRAIPVNAALFLSFEATKDFLSARGW